MNVVVDASLLVAASVEDDKKHDPARRWLARAFQEDRVIVITHTVAETYAGLTKNRVPPAAARSIIQDLLRQVDRVVELRLPDYRLAVRQVAEAGLTSGIIYDALVVRGARKTRSTRIATINRKHFRLIWNEDDLFVP